MELEQFRQEAQRLKSGRRTGVRQVVWVSPGDWRAEGLSVEAAAQLQGRLGC
ncbi:hypothetical protein ACLESD_14485 [Pyxidicoccus sp. 3LFB2]